ncbi:MAG TPA: adenosylcobinamide-GDP ribazoletransferase [Jatrophihabitans sp.]|nr:adenosylcobinamide-GDP ribazoletransferase [Jatrophihabitans sp.]
MSGLLKALGLFSIAPVRGSGELTRSDAVAALRWLPGLGVALGAVAGLPVAAVLEWAPHGALLGAVFAVIALAALTRGLHLDGLADTADGLGSRAPADRALQIMRRPDIGPFGVVAVVLVVFVDVASVVALDRTVWEPLAALSVAAATGRVSVLLAAHQRVPSARETGFGAYVAASVPTPLLVAEVAAVLACGAGFAATVDADPVSWLVAQVAALAVCAGVVRHVVRRLGGVSGDVFGALVEIGTALTLAGLALG